MKTRRLFHREVWAIAYLVAICVGCDALPKRVAGQTRTDEQVRDRVSESIAYLHFWTAGSKDRVGELARYGTGFVIEDPRRNKWILTSAHAFRPVPPSARESRERAIAMVEYRFAKQGDFQPCVEAILDESHDLAALRPEPEHVKMVPALRVMDEIPRTPIKLFAIGSPSALPVTAYSNISIPRAITIGAIAEAQRRKIEAYAPFEKGLTFIQHQIPIADGFSGCPIVTDRAEVVGLQSSTLPDAAFVGFAVHAMHLRGFPWNNPARKLNAFDLARFDVSQLFAHKSAERIRFAPSAARLLDEGTEITLGGIKVNAPFIHHGYIEGTALEVVEKYIQDKEWYLIEKFGGLRLRRLQELLAHDSLARISNPVLGLEMLVPKGYRIGVSATDEPHGMLVTFSPPPGRKIVKPYDWPLSIWVTVEPLLFAAAKTDFATKVAQGRITPTPEEREQPTLFAKFRERMLRAHIADVVDPRFAARDLKLRVWDDKTETWNGPKDGSPVTRMLSGEGDWLRSNYISKPVSDDRGQFVRINSREPLVVIVHGEFSVTRQIEFNDIYGVVDPTHLDFAIMASSVSLK